MAKAKQGSGSIFRQSAMDRIANVDDLDKTIKVTNPSAWAVIGAALALILALVTWSVMAIVPTSVELVGIYQDGAVICWVDEDIKEKIADGDAIAQVQGVTTDDLTVDDVPLSGGEVKTALSKYKSDYFAESIPLSTWNYSVNITLPSDAEKSEEERLVPVVITVSETRPIRLIFNG